MFYILTCSVIGVGTFNKLGGADLLMKGGVENEKERYVNIFPNHYYPSFTVITIYSSNIKEIYLTTA